MLVRLYDLSCWVWCAWESNAWLRCGCWLQSVRLVVVAWLARAYVLDQPSSLEKQRKGILTSFPSFLSIPACHIQVLVEHNGLVSRSVPFSKQYYRDVNPWWNEMAQVEGPSSGISSNHLHLDQLNCRLDVRHSSNYIHRLICILA